MLCFAFHRLLNCLTCVWWVGRLPAVTCLPTTADLCATQLWTGEPTFTTRRTNVNLCFWKKSFAHQGGTCWSKCSNTVHFLAEFKGFYFFDFFFLVIFLTPNHVHHWVLISAVLLLEKVNISSCFKLFNWSPNTHITVF